jgi:hypothetical protein
MSESHDYPLYPLTDCHDERTPGVLLLEGDDECKTTAQRVKHGWRIVDWEAVDFHGAPHWFQRSWHTVPDKFIAAILKATQP